MELHSLLRYSILMHPIQMKAKRTRFLSLPDNGPLLAYTLGAFLMCTLNVVGKHEHPLSGRLSFRLVRCCKFKE